MTLQEKGCDCAFWIKYSLFVINFLVWIGGVCLMIIGIWARFEKAQLGAVGDLTTDPAVFFMSIGIIMFIVSFFGCIGSLREDLCLLKIYCFVIVMVFLLEIIAGVLAAVYVNQVKVHMSDYMKGAIASYQDNSDFQDVVDYIQTTFTCCGAASYEDWESNLSFNCSSPSQFACSVPPSCCRRSTNTLCGQQIRSEPVHEIISKIYARGCIHSLVKMFKENLIIVGVLAFGVAMIELFAIILANLLMRILVMSKREQLETAHLYKTEQDSYDAIEK